ncbi:decaprenyl-phosphate phosphoribosyltransferase [Segatella bryantii]|uniref:decaprenyl-phosphate phosphoribosyltransferase n=1 Tax=Segatella bryantii TaxID=77095 RepID=UPI0024794885|nr:decaprenyl-phosphate phosphoribosyltransferase [Segatella bryantii]
MKDIIKLLRPYQWLKNLFVFAPVFFNGSVLDIDYLLPSFMVFFSFCMAASSIYCFNDIYDAETDRMHPIKRNRPIASGAVSKNMGYCLMIICLVLSIIMIFSFCWHSDSARIIIFTLILFYVLLNIAYCVWLKHKAIVDVFIIAMGFVIRIYAGGAATGIELTNWLVLMTFLLALFLAFAKRRDDVAMYETTGKVVRDNITRYTLDYMNQVIGIIASVTMVCYIMYTVSPEVIDRFHSSKIYLTSVFVLAGIVRYLQVAMVDVKSGSPTKVLLHDKFIQACVFGWILSFALMIYVFQ